MSTANLSQLRQTVQQNCHIADASHAADFTLCIYLLKMREFYRWENGQGFAAALDNQHVGQWLRDREALWETLEGQNFDSLNIGPQQFDPFDAPLINQQLVPEQLIYSAGLGLNNRPHFFLAQLEQHQHHAGYDLYIAGKEYARDLAAPPAMSQNKTIFIRKESLRRLLWEKLETWRWNRPANALGNAFACYDCETDLETALDDMTTNEVENVVLHEIGEIEAGKLLGPDWEALLFDIPHSKLALQLRAIRDLLADYITTLPELLERQDEPSLHFFFGNLSNLRKDLDRELYPAYQYWLENKSLQRLQETVQKNQDHWLQLCQEILAIYQAHPSNHLEQIQLLIETQCNR